MALQRGGLRYTIEVKDQFSAQIRRFRADVQRLRKELRELQGAQTKTAASARRAASAGSEGQRAQLARIRRLQAEARQKAAADKRAISDQRRLGAAAAQTAQAQVRGAQQAASTYRRLTGRVRDTAREFVNLRRRARRSNDAINRISFTFRRLIGIFATFAVARRGVQFFTEGIASSIRFNQTVEDSRIGFAALLSTMGEFRDEQGRVLQGQEAFNEAQRTALQFTNQIRQRALATTATYQELLRAVQAALGPGLEAGLDLDEIITVSERVSQAAASLALPQNQLVEEVRSLLRGTAQSRTSLVASVLFGGAPNANRVIRQAREAGNVFEVINERLENFQFAVQETQNSFSGLFARIRDASEIATGTAGFEFFEELKETLFDLGALFVNFERDAAGAIKNVTPRREAVQAFQLFFEGLRQALELFQSALADTSFETVASAFAALGQAIRVVVGLLLGLVQGIVRGFGIAAGAAQKVAQVFDDGGLGIKNMQEVTGLIGTIGTILVTAALAGSALAVSFRLINSRGAKFLIALAAIVEATRRIASAVLGIPVNFGDAVEIIKLSFQELWGRIERTGKLAFKRLAQNLVSAFVDPVGRLARMFADLLGAADAYIEVTKLLLGPVITSAAKAAGVNLKDSINDLERLARDFGEDSGTETGKKILKSMGLSEEDITAAKNDLTDFVETSQKKIQELATAIAIREANRATDPDLSPIDPGQVEDDAEEVKGVLAELNQLFDDFAADVSFDFDLPNLSAEAKEEGRKMGENFAAAIRDALEENEASGQGILDFFRGIVTNFEEGVRLVRQMTERLSSFVSDSIVDAFDPTTDTSLRERFAKFLQDIARMIIQMLVRVAIAKAVLGLANLFGSQEPGELGAATGLVSGDAGANRSSILNQGGDFGFAEGGEIPDGPKPKARPRGLDPRDTTQIWAQPGEFMMKLDAVRRYGADVMDAINRGLVDPSAMKSLLGKRSRRHVSGLASRGMGGYAEGGTIQRGAQQSANTAAQQQLASGGPRETFLVADNQTMDKLLTGGDQAMRRYIRDNSDEIRNILSVGG